jgi:hypothetical protein
MEYIVDIQSIDTTFNAFCEQYGLDNDHTTDCASVFKTFFDRLEQARLYQLHPPHHMHTRHSTDRFNRSYDMRYDCLARIFDKKSSFKLKHLDLVPAAHHSALSIGDQIMVSYMPYSQRYIEHYNNETVTGKVFFVDNENDDAFVVLDCTDNNGKHIRYVKSINKWGCGYFGNSRGYDMHIEKI